MLVRQGLSTPAGDGLASDGACRTVPLLILTTFLALACSEGSLRSPSDASDLGDLSDQSDAKHGSVSPPSLLAGSVDLHVDIEYLLAAEGAASSLGHDLEVQFDFGDGQSSSWTSLATASHAWASPGNYVVRARARSTEQPEMVSDWSKDLTIALTVPGPALADLFPPPQHQAFGADVFEVDASRPWALVVGSSPPPLVQKAAERIQRRLTALGATANLVQSAPADDRPVVLLGVDGSSTSLDRALGGVRVAPVSEAQGYALTVAAGPTITIVGADPHGVQYGATSLEQVLSKGDAAAKIQAPSLQLRDWPDIKQRVWGKIEAFQPWVVEQEYNEKFRSSFTAYLRDWLIPRRINIIHSWFTFHQRHWDAERQRYSDIPAVRQRLKLAVQLAAEWGVEIQYADRTGVGWDEELKSQAPFDQLIWHQGYFTCYSRDSLIIEAADEMGRFLADVGLRRVYIHQYDGTHGGWSARCSSCRQAYPDDEDPDKLQLAEAEAHLGNLYYETLKKHVPDLQMVMVESLYDDTGSLYDKHHRILHERLDPAIIPLIRETGRETIERRRGYYPGRPLYTYVENDESIEWEPIFDMISRFTQVNDFDDDRDLLFVSVGASGSRNLGLTLHAYYAWNVNAPGAARFSDKHMVYEPKRDTVNLTPGARVALKRCLQLEYGDKWASLYPQVATTWLSRGLAVDPKHLAPGRWQWGRIRRWFAAELDELEDKPAWLELHRLHMLEAQRVEPIFDAVFAEKDVPAELWRTYVYGKGTSLLAAPRYWELKCKQQGTSPAEADVQAGLDAVNAALAELPVLDQRIKDASTHHATQAETYMQVEPTLQRIKSYLQAL